MALQSDSLFRVNCMVLAGGVGERLRPLTLSVPKPLLHFGGVHRLMDFTLSNAMNSRLERVHVLTQYRHEEIGTYLRRHWPPTAGEPTQFIPRPAAGGRRYRGTADAVRQSLESGSAVSDLILVLSADHVYRMDYRRIVDFHVRHRKGATVAVTTVPREEAGNLGVLSIGAHGQVSGFVEKPGPTLATGAPADPILANMGVYVFNRWTFLQAAARLGADVPDLDFGRHVIPYLVAQNQVAAYRFDREDGCRYWRDVGTAGAFYQANMDLLDPAPSIDVFGPAWPVSPPGFRARETAALDQERSIVSFSALLGDCRISRSVVAPGVVVEDGAVVEESVLLPGAHIGRNASVRRAIVAPYGVVDAADRIGHGAAATERERFEVTAEGVVIVSGGGWKKEKKERVVASRVSAGASGIPPVFRRPGIASSRALKSSPLAFSAVANSQE